MAFPTNYSTFTPFPSGTTSQATDDHAGRHTTEGGAISSLERIVGLSQGSAILEDFSTGQRAVRMSATGGTLQHSINGTINNSVIGTSLMNGGTANNQIIGTPVINAGTVTQKVLQVTGNSELFQSGIGTISGTVNWTQDSNTNAYYKNGTITFPVPYASAPNLVSVATNDSLQTGCFTQVLTPVGTASGTVRISISTFNPSAAAQTFYWMAHGTI